MVDKNLFPYDLAVVAIFKDEAPYLREWLDYHLLAGVEHFYLYNNDSSDGYAEILKPYVDANIVTLIDWSGKVMQMPAYEDAVSRFRFFCRYIAFIDLDEFILPKSDQSVVEVVDEILNKYPEACGLLINWHMFGSNGHERADYSRGVLERFTRRAPTDWNFLDGNFIAGNNYWKTVVNPRSVKSFENTHAANCFAGLQLVNSDGTYVADISYNTVVADKIVVNHYYTKSREEFLAKVNRSDACFPVNPRSMEKFRHYDRNEVFDDSILTYRAARIQNFSLTNDNQRFARVEKALVDTLTQCSPFDAPAEFFVDKLETFLTCRRLAQHFGTRIGNFSAEEYALVWLYQNITQTTAFAYAEFQLLLDELPDILARPFPLCKEILQVIRENLVPLFVTALKDRTVWGARHELLRLQKFLTLLR